MILREKSYYKPFSNVHFVEFDFLSIDSDVVALSLIKSTVQESWKVDRKNNWKKWTEFEEIFVSLHCKDGNCTTFVFL